MCDKKFSNYIGEVYDFNTNNYLGKTLIPIGFESYSCQYIGKKCFIKIDSDIQIKQIPNKVKIIMNVNDSNMVNIYQINYIYDILGSIKDCYKCKFIEVYKTEI
jgi:hypothetical protein